ncbi:hypothetical protein UF75_1135 [Desulfosporosinus sp. I2]|nr:hypothetical protein UF75_1135 [Desulfosporosinus sp. I2]
MQKFIDSYVDKVIVYKDHLEVTFKVVFSFEQKNNIYSFTERLLEFKSLTSIWKPRN